LKLQKCRPNPFSDGILFDVSDGYSALAQYVPTFRISAGGEGYDTV
jgi:hypothetical protein